MVKYSKGILASIACMLFFWFVQYLGGVSTAIIFYHKFFMFKPFANIPSVTITPEVANQIGTLTFVGDVFVIVITLLIIKFIARKNIKKTFKLKKFKLNKFKVLIPMTLGVLMVSGILSSIIVAILFSGDKSPALVSNLFKDMTSPLSILATVLIAPIAEELIFRGILFNYIRKKINTPAAVIISSITFGIFHQNISQGLFAGALGILLSLMYVYTDSLFGDILTHMLVNTTSTVISLVLLSGGLGAATGAISGVISITYILIGPVLIMWAINIYRKQVGKKLKNFKVANSILIILYALISAMLITSIFIPASLKH
ncbi:CPBP family intramembrane glutamic endopeptidase [uncultured Clostridium sp.]|uniref:CPBP family intramembrane glutamic endopeptidase n=1 Tax=uncultured Clostridium sp. TaxID=59620 RepID=UPI002631DC9A|nr:type II CAAX endopeptidase family protein [uncultured Clostridium sp.]